MMILEGRENEFLGKLSVFLEHIPKTTFWLSKTALKIMKTYLVNTKNMCNISKLELEMHLMIKQSANARHAISGKCKNDICYFIKCI